MKFEKTGLLIEEPELKEKLRHVGAYLIEEKYLPYYEAMYFAEKKIIPEKTETIMAALKKKDKKAEKKYEVFKSLWNSGYVTRESTDNEEYFRIGRKGMRAGDDRTENIMRIIMEGEKYDIKAAEKDLEVAGALRKQFVLAIAGKDVRFIKISRSKFE